MPSTNEFTIAIKKFYEGLAPTYWKNSKTSFGNQGQANDMRAVNVLDPTVITQGPGFNQMTNGSIGEELRFLVDRYLNKNSKFYGLGTTKLFEIGPTVVTADADFPHVITDCTQGESIVELKGYLYYFWRKIGTSGNIGKHEVDSSVFDDDWGSTVPTGAATLQDAKHPSAVKEDLILFGNGRYAGLYNATTDLLEPTKLDFGVGFEVQDVIFHGGYWWIAVSSDVIGNESTAQIYLYDASGVSSLLSDEVAADVKRIGFLRAANGTVMLSYQDSTGCRVGYVSGKTIKSLGYISSLPLYYQNSTYLNTLIVTDGVDIYSVGSIEDALPSQISMLADGNGLANISAIASPFGLIIAGLNNGSTTYLISKQALFSTYSNWTSLIFDMAKGGLLACIDKVVVLTKSLGASAKCDLTIKINQEKTSATAMSITGTAKTRHVFKKEILDIEDLRVYLDWSGGDATNDCAIREIQIVGHWKEKI